MTSQYVTEPPTSGLVELSTSKGPILIELFSRECPLACRNFLTLALEGFYDNLLFHRLIPGFIIQSGDPSATGTGGESIYGEPFAIEPHSRLKFNRRGLLAMAAEDKQNESQFFLTLDATPELQGKHTMMGRVVGKSIYTLLELTEGVELIGEGGDRPRYPPKLKEVKVLENPFDDLKPRMTKEQRREEEKKQKEEAHKRRNEEEKKKKGKGKKNTALLSFGDEEEGEAEAVLKGPKSSHDLLKDDKRLSKQSMEPNKKRKKDAASEPSAPPAVESSAPSETIQSNGVLSRNRQPTPPPPPPPQAEEKPHKPTSKPPTSTTTSSSSARDYLSQQRAKYAPSSKKDSYDALLSFQSRLRASDPSSSSKTPIPTTTATTDDDDEEEEAREYGASDDDTDWREHRLDAGGKPLLASGGGGDKVEDYEVLDPREHCSSNGKVKDEDKKREGKRGRDWVDDGRRYTSYPNNKDREERKRGEAGEQGHRSSSYKSRSRVDGKGGDSYLSRSRDHRSARDNR